jgi:3,4-dihydroxy 2-butanone 4-phosphate synthase / GTP cyclohydrolase II
MARGPELHRFAATHDLVLITIEELIRYRRRTEPQVRRVVTTSLPTRHGHFTALGYASVFGTSEHLALVAGPLEDIPAHAVPVHVHAECLTADVFGATTCDCRHALDEAMTRFAAAGRGVIVYLRHDGPARGCSPPRDDEDTATHTTVSDAERTTVHAILTDLGTAQSGSVARSLRRWSVPSPLSRTAHRGSS